MTILVLEYSIIYCLLAFGLLLILAVYGHLQQIHLQRPSLCEPPKIKPFAAKPLAATFKPLAALLLIASHLQQNMTFAAKKDTCSKTTCTDHLQRPFATGSLQMDLLQVPIHLLLLPIIYI